MTSRTDDERPDARMPNKRLIGMFRVGTILFSVLIAWLAFRPSEGVEAGLPWDKANHAAAFLVWTILVGVSWPRAGLVRLAALMLGLGIGIELIQGLPSVGRDADVWDVVADMTGFAVGWTVLALLDLRRRLGLTG
ncbi:hypothetical protein [Brevundimonas sp. GCM10030266]|uniref:VanZ family protein n=1 Tax=Brevundimonas sp. GCM10030266 TaxID=3273386 RepID=UPI00361E25DF